MVYLYMVWAYQLPIPYTEYMVWYRQPPIYKGAYHTEYSYQYQLAYTIYHMKQPQPYTHDRLQQEIYQWLWNTRPELRRCFWHTPNEFIPDTFIKKQIQQVYGSKDKVPAFLNNIFALYEKHFVSSLSKRKAVGVLAGVTDLVCYVQGCLLMMDIKLIGDKLSDAQIAFIEANTLQGGHFIEINELEQGKSDINTFFKERGL